MASSPATPLTPTPALARHDSRSKALDVLRALAVLLVMFRHSAEAPASFPDAVREPLNALLRCGWIGVDLFFVLSGFLISGLLFSEFRKRGEINVARFLIRRGFKIYPPFFFFLIVSVLVQYLWLDKPIYLFSDPPHRIRPLWPEIVFMQSYFWGYWNHTWSLAVEEHFYIVLPILLWLILRTSRWSGGVGGHPPGASARAGASTGMPQSPVRDGPLKALIVVFLAIIAAAYLWRTQSTIDHPLVLGTNALGQPISGFHLILHFTQSHLRVDSLFVGVMLGYFYHFHRAGTLRAGRIAGLLVVPLCVYGVASIVPEKISSPYVLREGFLVLSASFAGLLWVLLSFLQWEPLSRLLASPAARPLRWLWALPAYVGMYSYSVYLWHIPLADWGHRWLTDLFNLQPYTHGSYYARMFSVTVLATLVGIITAKVVEFPALRLRDRLFPSLSGSVLGDSKTDRRG